MSNRPDSIGFKLLYDVPTETIFTNANVDAIDTATTSTDVYPHAYTATLSDQYDTHNWRTVATDVDLAAISRFAFGLFLSSELLTKGPMLYSCKGALNFMGESLSAPLKVYPIFGRCNAATITSTVAGTANQLVNYIVLPMISCMDSLSSAQSNHSYSVDTEIIHCGTTGTTPLFFGWVIENNAPATAYNFDLMQSSLCFQKYNNDLPMYITMR